MTGTTTTAPLRKARGSRRHPTASGSPRSHRSRSGLPVPTMVTILPRAYSATLARNRHQVCCNHRYQPPVQPLQRVQPKTTTKSSFTRSSCSRTRAQLTMVLRPISEKTSSTRCRLWNHRRCVTPLFTTVRAKVAADYSLVLISTTFNQLRADPHSPDHIQCPSKRPLTICKIRSKKSFY